MVTNFAYGYSLLDVIRVIYFSAIIFPIVVTAVVMICVRRALKKKKEREELIATLKDVVISQDKVPWSVSVRC